MRRSIHALAATLIVSLTGAASAQPQAGGRATSDANTSADLLSNGDKADNRTVGSARGGSDDTGGRPITTAQPTPSVSGVVRPAGLGHHRRHRRAPEPAASNAPPRGRSDIDTTSHTKPAAA